MFSPVLSEHDYYYVEYNRTLDFDCWSYEGVFRNARPHGRKPLLNRKTIPERGDSSNEEERFHSLYSSRLQTSTHHGHTNIVTLARASGSQKMGEGGASGLGISLSFLHPTLWDAEREIKHGPMTGTTGSAARCLKRGAVNMLR